MPMQMMVLCLQQGRPCLVLFGDPEGQKGLPCCPTGRQRNKHLLSTIIFKGLAASDLLFLGERELWGGEKVEFLWCPHGFSKLMPYPCKGYVCRVVTGSLVTRCSPRTSPVVGPGSADPRPVARGNRSARPRSLRATASSQAEPKPQAPALISFTLGMAVD